MYFIIITALTVSIDSFFCGFSLSLNYKRKFSIVFTIFFTVLLMCILTNYLAKFFAPFLSEKTTLVGGILLLLIGALNLIKREQPKVSSSKIIKTALLSGFAVGLDGAFANLSLALLGFNALYVPFLIALFHAGAVYLGTVLASTVFKRDFKTCKLIAPLILIALGTYKLLSLI